MLQKLVAAALAISACAAEAAPWSEPVRGAFVGSCVSAATNQGADPKKADAYCTCVNRTLEKTYTEQQFSAGALAPTEKYNADVQGAARECVKFLLPEPAPPGKAGAWSDLFRGAFVGSCADAAADKGAERKKAEGYCDCVGKNLEKSYSEDQFSRAAFKPTEKYDADVQGAARGCVKFLQP